MESAPVGPVAPVLPVAPVGPVSPRGIVNARAAFCAVPSFVTAAFDPGALVVVDDTVIVAAAPFTPGVPGFP